MKSSLMGPQFLERAAVPILSRTMQESAECRGVTARLTDFLEDALDATAHQEVATHLAQCSACSRTLHELRLTISLLSRLPKPER
jgi:anti-sigma factor RsiW